MAKAAAPAAAAPAAAAAQSPYALQANGAKLKANESTTYFLNKLRLIESRQLNEALTAEEEKQLDTLAQSYGDSEDPEIVGLMKQYSDVKNAALNATPAQAAQVTPAAPAKPTGPVTWKQIHELNRAVIGDNPNLIKPGQQLKMPDGSTYTVKPGDNLSKIAKNASGGQGASVTAVTPPKAPELTQTQQNLKNYGMYKPGDELRTPDELKYAAGLADATPNPDAGLAVSDPRHSGYAAWKKKQDDLAAAASQNAPAAAAPAAAAPGARAGSEPVAGRRPVNAVTPRRQPTAESVGYNELQRILSLVNHR